MVEAEVMEMGMLQAAWGREELQRVRPVDRAVVICLTGNDRLRRRLTAIQWGALYSAG